MHVQAFAWIARFATDEPLAVVDIGGRDINGSPRRLFPNARYTTVDLYDGPGVDQVGDCRDWAPPEPVDLVIVAEVLEHAPDPAGVVAAAVGYLASGGRLVLTCAGPGRAAHSGHDGGAVRDGEHYANIDPAALLGWLAGLDELAVTYEPGPCDVYATGIRR